MSTGSSDFSMHPKNLPRFLADCRLYRLHRELSPQWVDIECGTGDCQDHRVEERMSPSMDRRAVPNSSYSTRCKSPIMDASLWSLPPEEVLVSVLAWLPLHDLAQLRSVCKKWNALWSCPDFLKLRSRVLPEEELWYCFNSYDNEQWRCQGVKSDQLTKHSLCYLPKTDKKLNLQMSLTNLWPVTIDRVVATGGGLMLCVADLRYKLADNLLTDLIVCNPLKKDCWRKLPERRSLCHVLGVKGCFKDQAVGMIVDTKANTYKVVISSIYKLDDYRYQIVGRRPLRGSTEVYDSRTNRWKVLSRCLYRDELADKWFDKCETVYFQGYLFAYSYDAVYLYWDEKEEWISFSLPVTAAAVRIVRLEECQGRLFLVGTTSGDSQKSYEPVLVHVWEIECPRGVFVAEGTWRELSCVRYQELITRWPVRVGTEEGARFLASVRPNSTDLLSCIFNNSYRANSGISLLDFDLHSYTATHPYNLRSAGEALLLLKGDYVSLLLYSPSQNTWCLAAQDHIRGRSPNQFERCRGVTDKGGVEKPRYYRYTYLGPGYRFHPRIEASV